MIRPRRIIRGRLAERLAAVVALSIAVGCTPYRVGTPSLYSCNVRTVYVPIFESNSYRRGLGERLTEAVQKEIERRTPYKVVGSSSEADSVLTGRIVNEAKNPTVYAPTHEPRELQTNMSVDLNWTDRNGVALQPMPSVPVAQSLVQVLGQNQFYPEIGQSISTAQQQAIDRMARQIVGLLESPW